MSPHTRHDPAAPTGAEAATLYVAVEISPMGSVVGLKNPLGERIGLHSTSSADREPQSVRSRCPGRPAPAVRASTSFGPLYHPSAPTLGPCLLVRGTVAQPHHVSGKLLSGSRRTLFQTAPNSVRKAHVSIRKGILYQMLRDIEMCRYLKCTLFSARNLLSATFPKLSREKQFYRRELGKHLRLNIQFGDIVSIEIRVIKNYVLNNGDWIHRVIILAV